MRSFLILFMFLFSSLSIYGQLTLKVVSIPANTPADDDIYVAGNFQGWDPGDADYKLSKHGDETFSITISPNPGSLEFKFTRGSWVKVEGNENGNFRPNRTLQYTGTADTLEFTILSWEDLGGGGGQSTAADNVHILDSAFYMPELDRYRRIWIYLPPDYDTTQKHYPVLYMHDGQNVFDAKTSFFGEWEVDESLNQLFDEGDYGCIVVAIDNGGILRLDEYSPWINLNYGGGEGDEYMAFIKNTLKPYIDDHFRTLIGRDYTGLMGSSMGGLISLYGGIEYQDVFSRIGSFSPAYWFSPQTYAHVVATGKQLPMHIYTIVGELEGTGFVSSVLQMQDSLSLAGFGDDELEQLVHADGEHSEWYWKREFPAAYEWLLGDLNLSAVPNVEISEVGVFPNPAESFIEIRGLPTLNDVHLRITNMEGKQLLSKTVEAARTTLPYIANGNYLLEIIQSNRVIHRQALVINR